MTTSCVKRAMERGSDMNIFVKTETSGEHMQHSVYLGFVDYKRAGDTSVITVFGYPVYKRIGCAHQLLRFVWTR